MEKKAAIIRKNLFRTDIFGQIPLAYDLTDAVGAILDGAEQLAHPQNMHKAFQAAWTAYAQLWSEEYNNIVIEALGGRILFDQIAALPNARVIFARIIDRIEETHGQVRPGMEVDVNIDDILMDETGDLPGFENN